MVPDWPPLADLKREWVRMGPERFAAKYPDPILYVCGLLKASFAPADKDRTRGMTPIPSFEGFVKRSRLVGDKVIPLIPSAGTRVTLGSHPECDVMVPDLAVSHTHCAIETGPILTISDSMSTNGTWINEERIPAATSVPLMELDLICLGRYAFRLFRSASALVRHPDPTEGLRLLPSGQRKPPKPEQTPTPPRVADDE